MFQKQIYNSNCCQIFITETEFVIKNYKFGFCGGNNQANALRFFKLACYSEETNTIVAYRYTTTDTTKCICHLINLNNLSIIKIENISNFLYIGEERNNRRALKFQNEMWSYLQYNKNLESLKFEFSPSNKKTPFNISSKLEPSLKYYGIIRENISNKIKWFYWFPDSNYNGNLSIVFADILFDEFIEIDNTNFFLGKKNLNGTCIYRIFKGRKDKRPIYSNDYYLDCLYEPKQNLFYVRKNNGWSILKYFDSKYNFRELLKLSYPSHNFTFIENFIFAKREDNSYDIYDKIGKSYSFLWKNIRIVENSILYDYKDLKDERIEISLIPERFQELLKDYNMHSMDRANKTMETNEYLYNIDFYTIASISDVNHYGYISSSKKWDKQLLNKLILWIVPKDNKFVSIYIVRSPRPNSYKVELSIPFEHDLCYPSNMNGFEKVSLSVNKENITQAAIKLLSKNATPEIKDSFKNKTEYNLIFQIQNIYKTLISEQISEPKIDQVLDILFADKISSDIIGKVSPKIDLILNNNKHSLSVDIFSNDSFTDVELKEINAFIDYKVVIEKYSTVDAIKELAISNKISFQNKIKESINNFEQQQNENIKNNVINIIKSIAKLDLKEVTLDENKQLKSELIQESDDICSFSINNKTWALKQDQLVQRKSLIGTNQHSFIKKSDALVIFLDKESSYSIDANKSCNYEILGEGKDVRQTFGKNNNSVLRDKVCRVFIFIDNKNGTCSFFDEVVYVSHRISEKKTNNNWREVILFTVRSLFRFRQ